MEGEAHVGSSKQTIITALVFTLNEKGLNREVATLWLLC